MAKINTVVNYDPNAYCDEYPDTGVRGNDVMGGLIEEVRAQDSGSDDDWDYDVANDPMDSLDYWADQCDEDSESMDLRLTIEAQASDWLKERDNALGIKRLYELDDTIPF